MKPGDEIQLNIKNQGAPIVNCGYVVAIGEGVVALSIDLKSKYCEPGFSTGSSDGRCGLYISATPDSLRLNDSVDRNEPTCIEFEDFVGWSVFASGIGRYTLSVCLVKR